jgi:demethylmenaquinone methyltransferase/2-methoxy-6-polyprenyl-1,4-benzoquinol methylase
VEELLREQAAYYRAHAGRYDRGYELNPELRSLEALAEGLPLAGDVLELACGTGQWTKLLAGRGHRVTAVDGSPEMLARARARVDGLSVDFLEADLFDWRPPRRFDTVFFGFWLSHVPAERFGAFWELVGQALRPGGRACFVDSGPGDAATEELLAGLAAPAVRRRLADGSAHRVVKVFHDPAGLTVALRELGWTARVWLVGATLLAGTARPVADADPQPAGCSTTA